MAFFSRLWAACTAIALGLGIAILPPAAGAAAQQPTSLPPPTAFGEPPFIRDPLLSPDGTKAVAYAFDGTRHAVMLIRVEDDVEGEAWEILERHDDKAWSYVDAVSFALIEREGNGEAFAFDAHFGQRGLRVHPDG